MIFVTRFPQLKYVIFNDVKYAHTERTSSDHSYLHRSAVQEIHRASHTKKEAVVPFHPSHYKKKDKVGCYNFILYYVHIITNLPLFTHSQIKYQTVNAIINTPKKCSSKQAHAFVVFFSIHKYKN